MNNNDMSPPARLNGAIEKVFYNSPDFSAGKLRTPSGHLIIFAGNLYAKEGQRIVLFGNWIHHEKYGRQFYVKHIEHDLDLNNDGLVNYLTNHPDIKGIGPAKARLLVDAFGDNFEKTLLNEPEVFAKAGKVSMVTVRLLQKEWQLKRNTNAVRAWLSSFELTHHQVTTLVEKLGNNCLDILKADPYILIREIKNFGFKKVDKIARKMGTPKAHPSRVKAGIKFCLDEALDNGDCYVEFEELIERANALLIMDDLDSREKIETHLNALLDEKVLACQSHGGRILVANPDILKMESELAEIFKNGKKSSPYFSHTICLAIEQLSRQLNKKQKRAVENAIYQRMSLVSGGAGTGKTFLVSAIARITQKSGLKIILAAPTGKAAKRLEEVVGIEAKTIHRLLGYDGKEFSVEKIDADILCLDETSMIDVPLAWQLFKAIDLTKTSIVLVGDHNQLPPVGPGNILRDLIQSQIIPTTILEEVMRQAGALKENSMAILKGEVRPTSAPNENRCRDWYLVNKYTSPEDTRNFLCKLVEEQLQDFGFDIIRDVQILTPTHKGPLGTRELNIALQHIIQKKCNGVHVPPVLPNRRPPFLLYDKIIQTKNNYDVDVMNGTIGYITNVDEKGNLTIGFDGRNIEIEKGSSEMQDIQLAYALSIHKCVAGDTLLSTENGVIRIDNLADEINEGDTAQRNIKISTAYGIGETTTVSSEGKKECLKITTRSGYELTGANEHKVLTATSNGYEWKSLKDLKNGDTIVMRHSATLEHDLQPVEIRYGDKTLIINDDIAWMLGVLVGDGNQTDEEDYRVEVTKGRHDLLLRYISILHKYLKVRTTVRQVKNKIRFSAYFHNKAARILLKNTGLGFDKAPSKTIPHAVLRSPARVQRAFLRGLFDTDGSVVSRGVVLSTTSARLACEVQQLLFHHGIISSRVLTRKAIPEKNWSGAWQVTICGSHELNNYSNLVGFNEGIKNSILTTTCARSKKDSYKSNRGSIPFGRELIFRFRNELRIRDGRNYPGAAEISYLLSRIIR